MKKFAVILVALLASVGLVVADTVYTNAMGQVITVSTTGVATVSIAAGTAGPSVHSVYAAQTVTNNQTVTFVADVLNVLTSTGNANDCTNTIVINTIATNDLGKVIWVVNAKASTNLVAIAQSGMYDGPAFELSPGECAYFIPYATTNHCVGP